jgi:hypothetical protein
MRPGPIAFQLVLCAIFSGTALVASADVIDPFTAAQGPFTVGPGEEIAEEEAVVLTDSVLGGFRVMLPVVDEDAQAGSTATMNIGGGTFECSGDFPGLNENNNAACAGGYDRGAGPTFDLRGSSRFQFEVQSASGAVSLGVTLVDTNEEISLGLVPFVAPGQVSVDFDSLLSPTSPIGVDFELIDNIAFTVLFLEGQDGSVTISEFSTDGPIADGPVIPVDDFIVAEEIPGTYFNASRDGEGCQLTLERDQVVFVLTCYFYLEGEQFWLIGIGELVNGQIFFGELTITSGAQYGDEFDPADVVRTNWGSAIMTWSDCNNADLELLPILPGYEALTLEFTRIVPTICGGGGVQGDDALWMGAFFNAARDGEGFHFGVEAGSIYVMTWYTYLDGKQVWMIGTGVRDGNRVVFSDVVITYGADFGSDFDPTDVVREPFGEIIVDFSDCNNFTATVNSARPEFRDLVLGMTKIVPGACL